MELSPGTVASGFRFGAIFEREDEIERRGAGRAESRVQERLEATGRSQSRHDAVVHQGAMHAMGGLLQRHG